MKSLNILLSFDHELSLGGAKCYKKNMFDPTDRLLDLADEIDVPITLFTDVCCAQKFQEWDPDRFYNPYCRQITDASRRGHDPQLHLHPHWLDSAYVDGVFQPANSYSLGDFANRDGTQSIDAIVRDGVELLKELCSDNPDYKCIAFRAGGFCLTPNTQAILTSLYDHGIRIESTIAKDFQFACDLWSVDFRGMPSDGNWYVNPRGPVSEPANDGLYEIPIATRPRTPLNNIPFLIRRILHRSRIYRSTGYPIDSGRTSIAAKLKRLWPQSAWLLSFDHYADSPNMLLRTLRHHIAVHSHEETITCSALSHPKFMGQHARSLMRDFVNGVRDEYGEAVRFCSYQGYYEASLMTPENHCVREGLAV